MDRPLWSESKPPAGVLRPLTDTYIGFDSAWTDNPRAPGAICAAQRGPGGSRFVPPVLATFREAAGLVRRLADPDGVTLIGIDQPTVVPNDVGSRPVDRVAASVMSWLGGGVQPAFRGKLGMFCAAAPIWSFLDELEAVQDPEHARIAGRGRYVMEVFPALALATLEPAFCRRLGAAKYNPANRLFRPTDWIAVGHAAAGEARALGCEPMAAWCNQAAALAQPRKADQDRLDSVLCALAAMRWRLAPRAGSVLAGDLATGYMVSPASDTIRDRLTAGAARLRKAAGIVVPVDGVRPG